jgi:c-di-GMP-binding flagellar brake protein YcgR
MITKARTSPYQSLPDSEQITDPGRMVRLLERLAKQHTLLTVDITGHHEHYTSSIVGVDRPCVLLDELLPSTGHQLLLSERKLQVTGKLDGIDIRFVTTLERVDNRNNMVTYHMNLPRQIEYRQRRLAYRAHIRMAQTLRVIIDSRDGTVIEGVLHDLSRGGAGMIFPDGPPAAVPGLLYECAIELPDDVWLYCAVELRYSKNIRSRDRQRIGARLNDLSPAQARLVGHCVSELEREFVRKRVAE